MKLHLSLVRGNQNDLIQRQKQVIMAASLARACGNFLQKSNRKRQLQQFNLDYLFSLFPNAEVIVRPKIYKP